jgi:hypothetical protein
MAEGTGGVPGLPQIKMAGNQNVQTDVSSKNIFDLIKQGASQSMTSVLPYVQSQFDQQSKAAAPTLAAIKQTGEENAAMAQSDAGSRGMRGSDIEAAGMAGARGTASQQQAEFLGKLSMQQAESMAQYIMQAYGMDVKTNQDMYNNLAQAIGQELSQQREMQMMEEQLKLARAQMRKSGSSGILNSLITAGGTLLAGPAGGAGGSLLSSILGLNKTSAPSSAPTATPKV